MRFAQGLTNKLLIERAQLLKAFGQLINAIYPKDTSFRPKVTSFRNQFEHSIPTETDLTQALGALDNGKLAKSKATGFGQRFLGASVPWNMLCAFGVKRPHSLYGRVVNTILDEVRDAPLGGE